MYPIVSSRLGRRIVILVTSSLLLMLVALGVSGWVASRRISAQVLGERQALANAVASHLDYVLSQNLARLDNVQFAAGVDLGDRDLEPEKRALRSAYFGSIFDGGVFITDTSGTVLWAEPAQTPPPGTDARPYTLVSQVLVMKRPLVSNATMVSGANALAVCLSAPVRNARGDISGVVSGLVWLAGPSFGGLPSAGSLGKDSRIAVIDRAGVVIDSTGASSSSAKEVVESAQLANAPWSVEVAQAESVALAPVRSMEQQFIIFGAVIFVIGIFMSWGMVMSLVRPLAKLGAAAQSIARGDLSQPVPDLGRDEVGELGRSFDSMRIALNESLGEIQRWNRDLETKVAERTRQLEESNREIERKEAARRELLRKVLSAQEDERKRIARELHDETTQSLVALVMRLEAIGALPADLPAKTAEQLADARGLAVRTLDNVHKIIFDLRPSVLDDLGLFSALRWYAESRLGPAGIRPHIEVPDEAVRLPPQLEIVLFRVFQEAVTNIVRHSGAANAMLSVEVVDSLVRIEVQDDGKGFDMKAVGARPDSTQGLGLLGMEERVTLLGGRFSIESEPGAGTHLSIEVPVEQANG